MINADQVSNHPRAIQSYFSRLQFKKIGTDRFETNCPFHSDSKPSFQVNKSDKGPWLWICRSNCGAGNIIKFVERIDGINTKEAIIKLGSELGLDGLQQKVDETFSDFGDKAQKKVIKYSIHDYKKLEDALRDSTEARDWLLNERGITYETAAVLHFGFKQDIGAIAGRDSQIANKGWIVIPCIRGNDVTSIEYRSIVEKDFRRQPGMTTTLFNVADSDVLNTVYVTEGKFDAAVLKQAGFDVVSTPNSSTNIVGEMQDDLRKAGTLILAGDSDTAGIAATEKLQKQVGGSILEWPAGCKDANEVFLKHCGRDIQAFKALVLQLTQESKGRPMKNVTSLHNALSKSNRVSLADHPDRLKLPWDPVDKMFHLLPGGVMVLSSSVTGSGKTTFAMEVGLWNAMIGREVVLNYSAELSEDEYANLVAANVMKKDRNLLTDEDYKSAAKKIGAAKFWIGRDEDAQTADDVLNLIEAAIPRVGATLVILDHFHFIVRNVPDGNENQAQANAMKRIVSMAAKYNVKFIVVAQPRKATQQTKGKVVDITDMKGSETLISDAHVVLILHRDTIKNFDPANPPREPLDQKVQVILKKGRSQGTGGAYAELLFFGDIASFKTVSKDIPPPDMLI